MPVEPRYLITSADERTWKFDRPVIFLGEWCRLYERRHIWEKLDATVAAPYGLGLEKKDSDHSQARNIERKLFPEVCERLNQQHATDHDSRFWKIVVGHWFRRYVEMILNRVRSIEDCIANNAISGTTVFSSASYSLATKDSYSAIWAFSDDRWNCALYRRILELLDAHGIHIEYLDENIRYSHKKS